MEIVLLAVTVVSLIVAGIMSVTAWRLSREERARGAARVAALAAAAASVDESGPSMTGREEVREARAEVRDSRAVARIVPPTEPLVEPVAVNEPRSAPWTPARVSTFGAPRASTLNVDLMRPVADQQFHRPSTLPDGFLGSAVASPPSGGRQRGLAVAAVVVFLLVGGGTYWSGNGARSRAAAAPAGGGPAEAAPLELISLRHERQGPRLSVTGLVRNPAGGRVAEKLTAVVFLFDQQGGFITSARAGVDFLKLAPGDESPFVIAVEAPANVARYRVSFRNDEGIVSHIDRRDEHPVASNSAR